MCSRFRGQVAVEFIAFVALFLLIAGIAYLVISSMQGPEVIAKEYYSPRRLAPPLQIP